MLSPANDAQEDRKRPRLRDARSLSHPSKTLVSFLADARLNGRTKFDEPNSDEGDGDGERGEENARETDRRVTGLRVERGVFIRGASCYVVIHYKQRWIGFPQREYTTLLVNEVTVMVSCRR